MVFGANSKWTKGGTDGLVFSSDAPFSKFMGVKIDGKTIEAANYSTESGSTQITIFPADQENQIDRADTAADKENPENQINPTE